MSDKLYTYPIDKLVKWILSDLKNGQVFGFSRELFFIPKENHPFRFKRYGQLLEAPVGVAAGPHTQMSQNIILSWLYGARYIELKTVQTLDELEITKPCIDMTDEGFNCEWSQELKIHQSFDEYLNAWIVIHLLKDLFGWKNEEAGFIFNISVGYNLEGIKKPNVQWFLTKMNNCESELEYKVNLISKFYPRIRDIKIPTKMSDNVTLSTMHGCPPDEIESIVKYLIEKRHLHTAVKLNPTLLGPEKVREILNTKLGYDLIIPDEAFEHDLKWDDAVEMIKRLKATAVNNGVEFGLKLTNTLESLNINRFLPGSEKMVYMSGRALHPISINLAARLQNLFGGELDISFSAGVDANNISDTLKCNLKPITVCSDLLKPGGYSRMNQYFDKMNKSFMEVGAGTIEEFIINSSSEKKDIISSAIYNLNQYAHKVIDNQYYKKSNFKYDNIKTNRELTTFDCIHAPCIQACAISQDVPEYMYYTSKGEFDKAFEVIEKTNPLPNITGMVCDHLCQSKCTRLNYDTPLLIREIKRFIADRESSNFNLKPENKIDIGVAVIGAGPAGLAAAYFLGLEGLNVTVYETKSFAGGMAADAIPVFRITEKAIMQDIENIKSLGVKFLFNTKIDDAKFQEIKRNNDFIFISVGAQQAKKLNIKGEKLSGVYDQLNFLADVLRGKIPNLGKSVAIIGGGLSAVDAARTSKRLVGKNGNVTVVYRRTKNEIPCGWEEVDVMEEEGIEILELTSPVAISKNKDGSLNLKCIQMQLSDYDSSGRRKPIPVACSDFNLTFDSIVTAIGQEVVLDFFPDNNLRINQTTFETQLENVFAGGDSIRGADSLINAIADGQKVSQVILERLKKKLNLSIKPEKKFTEAEFQKKLSQRIDGIDLPVIPLNERLGFDLVHPLLTEEQAIAEASRCLFCNDVCNICVTVCPNIANISIETEPLEIEVAEFNKTFRIEQTNQILNIGDFCNECGNCETFCPTSGAPYKTKPKIYLTEESFERENNCYYYDGNKLKFKENGLILSLTVENDKIIYNNGNTWVFDKNLKLIEGSGITHKTVEKIIEMYFLLKNIQNKNLFDSVRS